MSDDIFIQRTADIVSAHVSNNTVAPGKLAGLIESVFTALSNAANPVAPEPVRPEPAVSIRASVKPGYIVCLEDGMKLQTLKRHLHRTHNMTPAEYRAKWRLPSDYRLIASDYSEKRRAVSLALGLGRKKVIAAPVGDTPVAAKKRGRPKASSAQQTSAAPAATAKPARKPRAKQAPSRAAK